jgi:hypothetical protein
MGEILFRTVASMKRVFWDVVSRSAVEVYQCYGGAYWLHH